MNSYIRHARQLFKKIYFESQNLRYASSLISLTIEKKYTKQTFLLFSKQTKPKKLVFNKNLIK